MVRPPITGMSGTIHPLASGLSVCHSFFDGGRYRNTPSLNPCLLQAELCNHSAEADGASVVRCRYDSIPSRSAFGNGTALRVSSDIIAVVMRARSRSIPSRWQTMAMLREDRPMRSTNNVKLITSPIRLGTLKSIRCERMEIHTGCP